VGDSAFASKHPLHIFASAEAISHATYYGSLQGLSCTMHAVCTLCKRHASNACQMRMCVHNMLNNIEVSIQHFILI